MNSNIFVDLLGRVAADAAGATANYTMIGHIARLIRLDLSGMTFQGRAGWCSLELRMIWIQLIAVVVQIVFVPSAGVSSA